MPASGGTIVCISDPSGLTALTGGQLAFEILCLLADSVAARRATRQDRDQTTENR